MSGAKPRFSKLAALTAAAAMLGAVALPLGAAEAHPYLGWDFGNGVGIGIGVPPSAEMGCPNYSFGPNYPYVCHHVYPF